MCLSTILFVLRVVCFIVLVYCLLEALVFRVVAVCFIVMMFCVWVGLLLPIIPCIVFYSVCVFCLWSDCLFKCSIQMCVLCCSMRELIHF